MRIKMDLGAVIDLHFIPNTAIRGIIGKTIKKGDKEIGRIIDYEIVPNGLVVEIEVEDEETINKITRLLED